jgi:hypothetical protein
MPNRIFTIPNRPKLSLGDQVTFEAVKPQRGSYASPGRLEYETLTGVVIEIGDHFTKLEVK